MVKIKPIGPDGLEEEPLEIEDADHVVVVDGSAKLLILHFKEIPAAIQHREYFNALRNVCAAHQIQLPPCIALVGDNVSLQALDENIMNELGWVRKEKAPLRDQVQA